MQAGIVYIQRAYGESFILIWLDRFTVIQTGVIAAIATFANYAAIFFCFRSNAVYGWY
jgi:hypothetical protein